MKIKKITVHTLLSCTFLVFLPCSSFGQGNTDVDTNFELQIAREKLEFEREKFEKSLIIEQQQLKVEERNSQISTFTLFIPLLIASLGLWQFLRQATIDSKNRALEHKDKLMLQVSEIILQSDSPADLVGRAQAFARIMGDELPPAFAKALSAIELDDFVEDDSEPINIKIDFWKALIANPGNEQEAVELWKQLFPPDQWINRINTSYSNSANDKSDVELG